MKGYRACFFEGLCRRLAVENVSLQVAYGVPWGQERTRGDSVDLAPPLGCRVESKMFGGRLLWLPVIAPLLQADRIIVEHANKNIINYPLALANALRMKRVAYWGHGRDHQSTQDSTGEKFRRRSLHWADWWFAYTEGAAEYVAEQGFDRNRITSVVNAVDTRELREQVASVSVGEQEATLAELGLAQDGLRLIYCGSLYGNKRLDLMLPAVDALHDRFATMQLIVIGGGPLADEVGRFAAGRPWARYVGPQFGRRKAVLLSLAHVWFNPGVVGLGILDAFSAGLPLVTTDLALHGPEIEYVEHGYNGLVVAPNVSALVQALGELLQSPKRLAALRSGAQTSATNYSIESMVENFSQGILSWLKS